MVSPTLLLLLCVDLVGLGWWSFWFSKPLRVARNLRQEQKEDAEKELTTLTSTSNSSISTSILVPSSVTAALILSSTPDTPSLSTPSMTSGVHSTSASSLSVPSEGTNAIVALPTNESVRSLNALDTSNNSRARVVFYAGLEGAGHHLLFSVSVKISRSTGIKLGSVQFPSSWACGKRWGMDGIQTMAQAFKKLDRSQVWTLPPFASYPECQVGCHKCRRDWSMPKLQWIAEAASKAGVDLHVILLYRPVVDCLVAGCIHRDFEPCRPYNETLNSMAHILSSQLDKMDSTTIHCFRYGNLSSMSAACDAAYGHGLRSEDAFKQVFGKRMISYRPLNLNLKRVASELQDADLALARHCN